MRISRPCYNKPHRCPGWAGGGMHYARKQRCEGGRLRGENSLYSKRAWQFRFNRCTTCEVLVLPFAVHWLDWRSWLYTAERIWEDWQWQRDHLEWTRVRAREAEQTDQEGV